MWVLLQRMEYGPHIIYSFITYSIPICTYIHTSMYIYRGSMLKLSLSRSFTLNNFCLTRIARLHHSHTCNSVKVDVQKKKT